jgi:hypothetical protein
MTFSIAGLIGAIVGLAMALGAYVAVTLALTRQAQQASAGSAEEREQGASMIRTILLADIPILAGIGYYLGQTLE